jgi:hypothetical protein
MQWVGDAIELRGLGVEGAKITGFHFPVITMGVRAFWISWCILHGHFLGLEYVELELRLIVPFFSRLFFTLNFHPFPFLFLT